MIYTSKENFRIINFLRFLGFCHTKEETESIEDVFYKNYHLSVIAEIENQDEDEKFQLNNALFIYVGSQYIAYQYKKFVALESGRLSILQMNRTSEASFNALLKTLTEIFNELYGSINYEFYSYPYMPIYPRQ